MLYVGGYGRSGSTLLAYLLGMVDGFWPVGELREVWTKGVMQDNLCSCGAPFSGCDFWGSVGARAFGGWGKVDVEALAATSEAVATDTRLVPALLAGRREPLALMRLREQTVRLIGAIGELTSCQVIVDSSKFASYALLMASGTDVHLRVIQLVRDSHAVAFSWAKKGVLKPDVEGRAATMDTYPVRSTALRWSYHNGLFGLFPLKRIPLARMRYEELVAAPQIETEKALSAVGLSINEGSRAALASGSVSLDYGHTIGGNPMRFRGSEQAVRLDDEWRAAMPGGMRRSVTLLTWPLLMRYGYMSRQRSVPPL